MWWQIQNVGGGRIRKALGGLMMMIAVNVYWRLCTFYVVGTVQALSGQCLIQSSQFFEAEVGFIFIIEMRKWRTRNFYPPYINGPTEVEWACSEVKQLERKEHRIQIHVCLTAESLLLKTTPWAMRPSPEVLGLWVWAQGLCKLGELWNDMVR